MGRRNEIDEHGDLTWDAHHGGRYVIRDITDKGYDVDHIKEHVFPHGEDGSWEKSRGRNGGVWLNHDEYDDAYARFCGAGDFELKIPKMRKQSQYDELDTYLRTGTTVMGDTTDEGYQHAMDFFLEWLYEPRMRPMYS